MRRILVAVDGSRASQEAARTALAYAAPLGARVTLLYVLPPPVAGSAGDAPDFAPFEYACEAHASQLVDEVLRLAGGPTSCVDTAVAHGEPAEVILEAARAPDVDLVIVGTRGRGALARALLGSVSAALVTHCPKPVLVVPEPARPPAVLAPPSAK